MTKHLRLPAVLVSLCLAGAGCGSANSGGASAAPGVTATTINTVGGHYPDGVPLSGVAEILE
jgi:hypothetical protein